MTRRMKTGKRTEKQEDHIVPNVIFGLVGIAIIVGLVLLKRKFDPNNDAFRTEEREGWHFAKAGVVDLAEYKRKRKEKEDERTKNHG